MIVALLGAPGSGKGTQADKIREILQVPHISTGDILRETARKDTPLAKQLKEYMTAGKLVPDEIMIEIVHQRIDEPDCRPGFILDGFPRTVPQAQELDKLLKGTKRQIDKVINLTVSDEILMERLSGRRTCTQCKKNYHIKYTPPKKEGICDPCGGKLYQRTDDQPETIKQRLLVYKQQTQPLLDYYKKLVINVNGEEKIDRISARLAALLKGK